MITEKMIEKHKYFTCGLRDMWILRSVETRKVATFERIDKVGTEGKITIAVELGRDTSAKLVPAVIAEHKGNEKEAIRLRKLAEQKSSVAEFERAGSGPCTYDCDGCSASYQVKPDTCGKCMGRSFSEIPANAQGKAEEYANTHRENCGAPQH